MNAKGGIPIDRGNDAIFTGVTHDPAQPANRVLTRMRIAMGIQFPNVRWSRVKIDAARGSGMAARTGAKPSFHAPDGYAPDRAFRA